MFILEDLSLTYFVSTYLTATVTVIGGVTTCYYYLCPTCCFLSCRLYRLYADIFKFTYVFNISINSYVMQKIYLNISCMHMCVWVRYPTFV